MKNSKTALTELLTRVNQTLETENASWRPADREGRPGGLVLLKQDLPTLIVPDLHGRSDFLPDLLRFTYKGVVVYELLKQAKIQIVCVGDGMHSERRAIDRWRKAHEEYKKGFVECPAMAEEMTENFQTMAMVMRLKITFPELFHFLKGNHENIRDENKNGNHPFAKLAAEGPMVHKYVEKFYGPEFLALYDRFEKNLPLLTRGRHFIISHARPKREYSIEELINYRSIPEVVEGLTWTRHNVAKKGAIQQMLQELLGTVADGSLWFVGHTAIKDLYHFWNEESLLEIHNPALRSVVAVDPNESFDPDIHIHTVPRPEN